MPKPILECLPIHLPDANATRALGINLARAVEVRTVVALQGKLGAGKTTLVQGAGAGLGVDEVINSPTFTMLNEYHAGRLPLFHFDLYRLLDQSSGNAQTTELFAEFDEILNLNALIMIEWADCLVGRLPADRLEIALEYVQSEQMHEAGNDHENGARKAVLTGLGEVSCRLLQKIAAMVIYTQTSFQ